MRYRTLDSSFSYITSKASSDAFYSDSQFIGFGLSYKQTGDTELRLVQTFPGSPAADAGMDRGDYLLSVNGKAVADLLRTGEISTIFGAEQVGVTADLAWRDAQGRQKSATLTKRLVTIPTVSQTAVLSAGSSRVAYIHFRNFVQPSVEALNTAFTQVRDAGATELVLDLRYNGGGLVSVAQHLAGLIGGAPLVGQVFVQFTHNDKQTSRNTAYNFEAKPQALAVTRLVVIATRGSASASEAIINGLRPYMDVKVVGDATYGKPVGQYGFDFCEKVLYPVCVPGDERARRGGLLQRDPGRLRRRGRRRPRAGEPAGGLPRRGPVRREERPLQRHGRGPGRGAGPLPRARPPHPDGPLAPDAQRLVRPGGRGKIRASCSPRASESTRSSASSAKAPWARCSAPTTRS